jgi:hypothetical protein
MEGIARGWGRTWKMRNCSTTERGCSLIAPLWIVIQLLLVADTSCPSIRSLRGLTHSFNLTFNSASQVHAKGSLVLIASRDDQAQAEVGRHPATGRSKPNPANRPRPKTNGPLNRRRKMISA